MLIAGATSVRAAQPLVTDDAAVLAAKSCQLEAWVRSTHDAREYGAQPACNLTGNLELSVGFGRADPDAGERSSATQLQAKTVLYPRADGAWSFGAVAGAARDTGAPHGTSAFQTYYAKGLASWYPGDKLEVDLNLGGMNNRESGTIAVAGAAMQYTVAQNVQLLFEVFRDEPGSGKYQVGVRYLALPDRFETYVSYGNRFAGSSDSWSVTVGIRVQTAALLR